jgi:hypothetical protein
VNEKQRFERFLETARRGRPETAHEPAFGFATRVAASAMTKREDPFAFLENIARRFLVAALVIALCVGTGVIHLPAPKSSALADLAGLAEAPETPW